DCVYFDDFLHPGIEAIGLAFPSWARPRLYAWLHGTCFDPRDFLAPKRRWLQHYERMVGEILDGTFVACGELKKLATANRVGSDNSVYATGHVWDTEEVRARCPHKRLGERTNTVVYSSRWDGCKDPLF